MITQVLDNYSNMLIPIILLVPFIAGITLGWCDKITIFDNYNDLGLTFLLFLLLVPLYYIFFLIGTNKILLYFFVLIESILLVVITFNSFINNKRNIFYTLLALYTKIPLSFMYLANLYFVIGDILNKNKQTRNKSSYVLLIVLTPIINKLVKNKAGVLK